MTQYINTETGEDDLSDAQVREAFPDTHFAGADFPPAPFAERLETEQPAFNVLAQDVVRMPSTSSDGAWRQVWAVVDVNNAVAAQRLSDASTVLVLKIDADADVIRNAVIGGRATEYLDALADAEAFEAASFTGTVPSGVKSWVDAKNAVGANWTAQQAAEDILATGSAWKSAQAAIRTHRLLRKEQIKAATTFAGQQAAIAAWTAFTVAIRSQLGV